MLYSWGLDGGAWHWRIGGIRSVLICHPAVTQASCTGAEPASRAQWKLTFLGSLLAWAWWAGCVRVCCCFKLLVGLGSGRGHLFLTLTILFHGATEVPHMWTLFCRKSCSR